VHAKSVRATLIFAKNILCQSCTFFKGHLLGGLGIHRLIVKVKAFVLLLFPAVRNYGGPVLPPAVWFVAVAAGCYVKRSVSLLRRGGGYFDCIPNGRSHGLTALKLKAKFLLCPKRLFDKLRNYT